MNKKRVQHSEKMTTDGDKPFQMILSSIEQNDRRKRLRNS